MSEQSTSSPNTSAPERNSRRVVEGIVTSTKAEKTITVVWERQVRHGKFGKFVRRKTKLHAHCEDTNVHEGDQVEIMACRPISKLKTWRFLRVVRKAHVHR